MLFKNLLYRITFRRASWAGPPFVRYSLSPLTSPDKGSCAQTLIPVSLYGRYHSCSPTTWCNIPTHNPYKVKKNYVKKCTRIPFRKSVNTELYLGFLTISLQSTYLLLINSNC